MYSASSNRPQPTSEDIDGPIENVDISVVIVNYNVREFLEQTLRSIERASGELDVEIFVVDNHSSDGSIEMVWTQFPRVHVIGNDINAGFGKANNQAIREARGRYLFILNPDTIIREDTLSTFVRFMDEHPDAGAVGCKILNPDGSFAPESRRSFPTPSVAFYRIVGLSKWFPKSPRFGRYNMSYLSPDVVAEVDALSGSCMLVRNEALRRTFEAPAAPPLNGMPTRTYEGAGLFDEDFFMYGEDLDWCYRIQQAGWKIYYTPDTEILHYKGESTKKGELRYVFLFYGAMLRFARKHFKRRYSVLFLMLLRTGIVVRGGLHALTNWLKRIVHQNRPPRLFRRLLVVGDRGDTGRLVQLQSTAGIPSLELVGVMGDEPPSQAEPDCIPYLGSYNLIDQIVREQNIEDILFASNSLSYHTIFDLMGQLRDAPIRFRIVSPGFERIIGPDRIDNLSPVTDSLDIPASLFEKRSTFGHRALEVLLALGGMLVHPFMVISAALIGKKSRLGAWIAKTRQSPALLTGRRSLVGYREEEAALIDESWHLKPGVFTITDTLPPRASNSTDLRRAYWLYACNRSVAFDMSLIVRSFKLYG